MSRVPTALRRVTWVLAGAAIIALGAAAPGWADDPPEAPALSGAAPTTSVTVNGEAMAHGSGSTRLAGCSLEIAVAGLSTPGPHVATARVEAMEPTGSGVVWEQTAADVEAEWTTGEVYFGDLLAPFEQTSNGYHLRVTVLVDEQEIGSAPYWLACGADQHEGSSWWVQFQVAWRDVEGKPTAPPELPGGWILQASSDRGSATCTYDAGNTLLCTYVDEGHSEGDDHEGGDHAEAVAVSDHDGGSGGGSGSGRTGLRVPGLGIFTVAQHGLPAGWEVDPASVGEFLAQSLATSQGDHGAARVIVHTVINNAVPVIPAPPTPEPVTPAAPSAPEPATTFEARPTEVLADTTRPQTLPVTGAAPGPLVVAGLTALAAGAGLLTAARAANRTTTAANRTTRSANRRRGR